MSESLPRFFSVKSAARDYFGGEVSPWSLRGWIKSHRIRAVKAGGRVLIPREELDAFLKPRPDVTSRKLNALGQGRVKQ